MKNRAAVGLEVLFKSAELGTKGFEPLAKGSAICVQNKQNSLSLVTCLHILHPFRFPQYYPPNHSSLGWVHSLTPSQLSCRLKVIGTNGEEVDDFALSAQDFHTHRFRDLVSLSFPDESSGREFLNKHDVTVFDLPSPSSTPSPLYSLHGHIVLEREETSSQEKHSELPFIARGGESVEPPESTTQRETQQGEQDVYMVYHEEQGEFVWQGTSRGRGQDGLVFEDTHLFVGTGEELSKGMCGGAVLDHDGNLVGLVEGILSRQAAEAAGIDANLASILPVSVLNPFLR